MALAIHFIAGETYDMYKETYRDLSHGTDEKSARTIIEDGFKTAGGADSWCGKGVYFYDIKKKAWWAANRKCREIKKKEGLKIKPAILFADIIDIEDSFILDLRVKRDLCDFEKGIQPLFGEHKFKVEGIEDETESLIKLRALMISFYADKSGKKLVIGNFRQRPQPLYEHAIEFSNSLDMIFGIETIYCVKDRDIIENIRMGGRTDG